jgi:hypothetical protein
MHPCYAVNARSLNAIRVYDACMKETDDMVNVRIRREVWESVCRIAHLEGRSGAKQMDVLLIRAISIWINLTNPPPEHVNPERTLIYEAADVAIRPPETTQVQPRFKPQKKGRDDV